MKQYISILSVALATLPVNVSAQTYVYDDAARLEKILYANGKGVVYTYDIQDNLTQVAPIEIPRAVENLKITSLSLGQAELSWEHSGDVLLFLIQSKPIGTDKWTNGGSIDDVNARTAIVDLPFGQELVYRIIVFGNSIAGESAPSVAVQLPSQTPLMVTTLADENDHALGRGAGDSLREVIEAAESGEVINFSPDLLSQIYVPLGIGQPRTVVPTIYLEGTQLRIDKNLSIDASALPNNVRIDAGGLSRVFFVTEAEVVLLKGLKITGGDSSTGGALLNDGVELTLDECVISDNISPDFGGGVYNDNGGTLVLDETTVSGNIALEGGGVYNADAALQIRFSSITGNLATNGGGIYHAGTSLLVDRSAVFANEATNNGGGLFNDGADALLENSTFNGNASADDSGGGIANESDLPLVVRHCTIVANTGTGIVNGASANLTLDNSIVANNFNTLNAPDDIEGDFTAVASNLVRVHNGTLLSGPAPLTDDPLLGSFGSYGGRSSTMPPLPGSPALEAGIVTANTPSTDQDSAFRPNGAAPELGSIESRLSSETNLAWLTSSVGTLTPIFRSQRTTYTAAVPNNVTTAAFRPAGAQFGQTIEVRLDGGEYTPVASKAASSELPLAQGDNTVEVRVTAQNEVTTKIYTIVVSRGAPSIKNTDLSALTTSVGNLSPVFDSGTRVYNTVVANGTFATTVSATSVNGQATLRVRSNYGSYSPLVSDQSSSPIELHVGKNAIDIEVTAQDGATTSIHSIFVTREAPADSNALLAALSTSAGSLSPSFNGGVSVYETDVPGNVASTTVSATSVQASASIQVRLNGGELQNLASGTNSQLLVLVPGENVIEVSVTAESGTLQTYTLIVNRIIESIDWISEAGDANSTSASMSSDCRYVAFASNASNLISGSVNNNTHIYVYDRVENSMRLISKSDGGQQGDRNSADPVISADGRFVAFQSEARNLVPNDENGNNDPSSGRDIFVYDLTLDAIERVSLRDNGGESNQASEKPSISGDGRYVAFVSSANNIVSGFANDEVNVYVYDRTEDTVTGISVPFGGFSANRASLNPSISVDGRYVAFEFSVDKSVGSTPGYQYRDIYLYGRATGVIQRITGVLNGPDADGSQSSAPSISADGRYVAFVSNLESIDFYDTNKALDVFVFDRVEQTTRRVSANGSNGGQLFMDSTNPFISGDGNYVAFESMASNLVDADTNNSIDIFVTNLNTGEIVLVSVNPDGTQGDQDSLLPSLSYDGRCVVFHSRSSNFNSEDSNLASDVFVSSIEEPAPSSNTALAGLTTSLGEIMTSGSTFNTSIMDGVDTVSLALYPVGSDSTIKASVNGASFADLPVNAISSLTLEPGLNSIEIQVTAENGSSTKTYNLEIARKGASDSLLGNANISALETSAGLVAPNFDSDTLVYTASVSSDTSTATISPVLTVAGASITVNGVTLSSGETSEAIALNFGSNAILATVTALDGITKKTYVIAITRSAELTVNISENQIVGGSPDKLRITWESAFDAFYVIEKSTDLVVWQILEGEIPSQGSLTTFDVELNKPSSEKTFLRVRIK